MKHLFFKIFFINAFKTKTTKIAYASLLSISAVAFAQGQPSRAPVALDWKKSQIASPSYEIVRLQNGAVLAGRTEAQKRFEIRIVFGTGVYEVPAQQRPLFTLATGLLNQAGAGDASFEEFENQKNAIGLETNWSLSHAGYLTFYATALSRVSEDALALIRNHITRPNFSAKQFAICKQKNIEEFENLLAGTSRQAQSLFLEQEIRKLQLGKEHFYTTLLSRRSKKTLQPLTLEQTKSHIDLIRQAHGTLFTYAGGVTAKNIASLKDLAHSLKAGDGPSRLWVPERVSLSKQVKPRVVILEKPDMTQYTAAINIALPEQGKLNEIEATAAHVLEDVFSTDRGVVGSDRFSKALRVESGLSYGPHAHFLDYLRPNTNGYLWQLRFELPQGKLVLGINIALATWKTFLAKGVSQEEFERSRVALMNSLLSTEQTVFSDIEELSLRWQQREDFLVDARHQRLRALENPSLKKVADGLLKAWQAYSQIAIGLIGPHSPSDIESLKQEKDLVLEGRHTFDNVSKELQ